MKETILKLINEEIVHLTNDMKNLDKQYIDKQKRLRELKKQRDEVIEG